MSLGLGRGSAGCGRACCLSFPTCRPFVVFPPPVPPTPRTPLTPVTLFERYALANSNTGWPMVVVYVLRYPAAELPSLAYLHARVGELQERLALLHARVVRPFTRTPGLAAGAPWAPAALVRDLVVPRARAPDDPAAAHDTGAAPDPEALILRAEIMAGRAADHLADPLWSVARFAPRSTDTDADGPPAGYLALRVNHIFIDGRGAYRLLHALATPGHPVAPEGLAQPGFDATLPIRPAWPFLLRNARAELLVPLLPRAVQALIAPRRAWPAEQPSPTASPFGIAVARVPRAVLGALRAETKRRAAAGAPGGPTLHPVIHAAYMAALWAVFAPGPRAKAEGAGAPPTAAGAPAPDPAAELYLTADTPRDERSPALGHPHITQAYAAQVPYAHDVRGGDGVWALAGAFAAHLASPAAIAEARETLGLLAWLPDPPVAAAAATADPAAVPAEERARATGWERWVVGRMHAPAPYRESAVVTNLGAVPLPPGAADLSWGQICPPGECALVASIAGHAAGLRLSTAWFDGSPARAGDIARVHRIWERALARLAAAASDGDITVAQITADAELLAAPAPAQ